MSTAKSTTIRVPTELRDEIARIAVLKDTTMVEVVSEAIHLIGRNEWWTSVRGALDGLGDTESAGYRAEMEGLESASRDGLDAS